jgi:hypothetical protein
MLLILPCSQGPIKDGFTAALLDGMGSPYNARHDSETCFPTHFGVPVEPG